MSVGQMPKISIRVWVMLLAGAAALAGCSKGGSAGGAVFDGSRAFALLDKQVALGPRVPGTLGHIAAAALIKEELKGVCDAVVTQDFVAIAGGKRLSLTNIIGVLNPSAMKSVLLCAHWDTRPTADNEIFPSERKKPIPGANDGASGVAVLLELARVFAARKPDMGVVLVFFDGEDYGTDASGMFLGSKKFAKEMASFTVEGQRLRPEWGVLLDMVGDKDLTIYREANSMKVAPDLVDRICGIADRLGYAQQFPRRTKYLIEDDHLPLIRAGLPCVDIIDFDYAHWHTLADTPDKCSLESLKIVGDVISALVYGSQ